VWRRHFAQVRGLPDKGGYTKWFYLGGVPCHKKKKPYVLFSKFFSWKFESLFTVDWNIELLLVILKGFKGKYVLVSVLNVIFHMNIVGYASGTYTRIVCSSSWLSLLLNSSVDLNLSGWFLIFQVNALLCSLDIDGNARARGPLPGRFRELEDYWNESQGILKPGPPAADGWVAEFSQQRMEHGNGDAWAHSYEQQHGANGWASEFEKVRKYLNLHLVPKQWIFIPWIGYNFCLSTHATSQKFSKTPVKSFWGPVEHLSVI
jgi:hypothetical protein